MKMTFRYGWMLGLILVLMLASIATAQDMDSMCESVALSPEDCAIYTLANSAEVHSVQFDLDLALTYKGAMFGDEPVHMAVVGSLWMDPDKLDSLADLANTEESPIRALQEAIAAVNTRMDIAIDLPEWVRYGTPEIPQRLRMGLALVESVGYVELSDLHQLDPDNIPSGWYGLDIRPFIPVLLGGENNPFRNQTYDTPSTEMTYPFVEGYDIVRLPDVTIDGRTAAAFQIDVDFEKFFDSMSDSLIDAYAQQGMSPEEAMAQMDLMISLVGDSQASLIQIIDIENGYTYTYQMEFDMPFSDDTFETLYGTSYDMGLDGMKMILTLEMRGHNETAPATAPDNAEIIPFTEIMPLLLGQQSS